MSKCPNFPVCGKMYDPTLKVCGRCFWRFKNEILEFKNDECPICLEELTKDPTAFDRFTCCGQWHSQTLWARLEEYEYG